MSEVEWEVESSEGTRGVYVQVEVEQKSVGVQVGEGEEKSKEVVCEERCKRCGEWKVIRFRGLGPEWERERLCEECVERWADVLALIASRVFEERQEGE